MQWITTPARIATRPGGGQWSTGALDGRSGQVNHVAFHLPCLAMLEFWLWRRAGAQRATSAG